MSSSALSSGVAAPSVPPSCPPSSNASHRPVLGEDRPRRPLLVYYHIPSDHDDAQHPNAFPLFIRRPSSGGKEVGVRLRDIKQRFPLPGKYHFRFKVKLETSSFFWIDIWNDDSIVPQYNNKIIAKVLRVDWDSRLGSESSLPTVHPSTLDSSVSVNPHLSHAISSTAPNIPAASSSTIDDMLSLDAAGLDSPAVPGTAQHSSHPKSSDHPIPSNTSDWFDDLFGQ